MAEDKDYILYTHTNSTVTTVSAFINYELSIIKGIKKREFLNFKAEGVSNLQRIWNKYTSVEQTMYSPEYQAGNLDKLKTGTVLALPKINLNRELVPILGKNQVVEQGNYTTFLADKLLELQNDPEYTPLLSYKIDAYTTLKETIPEISVWIWVRSLDSILDVTPFVESLTTSVVENGGDFHISLAPTTVGTIEAFHKGFISDGLLHKIKDKELKRSDFFFHKYLSYNDVVFIRFEALRSELTYRKGIATSPILKNQLPNKIYDMVGLIDENSLSSQFQGNDVRIDISGRDLIKLFQEDGSYYFPITLTLNHNSNETSEDPAVQRTIATGGNYDLMVTKGYRSVRSSLEFIINLLATIEVVPSDLFEFYGKSRTEKFKLDEQSGLGTEYLKGIWQIVKLVIDESIADRVLADDSLSMPDGDLQDQLMKICQKPFVEYLCDTYGDQWHLVIRRPPFTKDAILQYLDNNLVIDIEESDVLNETLSWNTSNIYSWYKVDFFMILVAANSDTLSDILPAVYFSDYAKIWGNKKLEIVDTYIPSPYLIGATEKENSDYLMEQVLEDYMYVIESHLYMPFTRQGNITIRGDRRIKRGTFVRLKGTDEIYYVNSVTNSYSVGGSTTDRATSLGLIRGMKEKYIKGVSKSILTDAGYRRQKVSYFNIVDLSLVKKFFYNRLKTKEKGGVGTQLYSDFKMNPDVFNFFLERKQFDD